jgi:hypothetical protein
MWALMQLHVVYAAPALKKQPSSVGIAKLTFSSTRTFALRVTESSDLCRVNRAGMIWWTKPNFVPIAEQSLNESKLTWLYTAHWFRGGFCRAHYSIHKKSYQVHDRS